MTTHRSIAEAHARREDKLLRALQVAPKIAPEEVNSATREWLMKDARCRRLAKMADRLLAELEQL